MPKSPDKISRAYAVERKPFERSVDNSKFYNSWPWRKLRKKFLQANPLCKHCEQQGIVTPATVADHVQPITLGGAALEESNLQALCDVCHNKKSAAESRRSKGGMG